MIRIYLCRHSHTEDSRLICYKENSVPLSEIGRAEAKRLGEYLADKGIEEIYTSPYQRAVETAEIARAAMMMDGRDAMADNGAVLHNVGEEKTADTRTTTQNAISHIKADCQNTARENTTQNSAINDIKIYEAEALQEINMGLWQGKTFTEIKKLYPKEYEERGKKPFDYVVPQGESFRSAYSRIYDFIINLCTSYKEENVLKTGGHDNKQIENIEYQIENNSENRENREYKEKALKNIAIVSHSGIIKALIYSLNNMGEEEFFTIRQDFSAVNILEYDEETEELNLVKVNLRP